MSLTTLGPAPIGADYTPTHDAQPRPSRRPPLSLLERLFGYDVFIAYRRADGATYAAELQRELGANDVRCFLDVAEEGFEHGQTLDGATPRAIARSAHVVVVCTEGAFESPHVLTEARLARRLERKVIPIAFGTSFEGAAGSPLHAELEPYIRLTEAPEARDVGPSPAALGGVLRSLQGSRRNVVRRRIALSIVAGLVGLALLAGWSVMSAAQRRRERDVAASRRAAAQFASEATRLVETDPLVAATNLERAFAIADSIGDAPFPDAEVSARQWMTRRLRFALRGHRNNLMAVKWTKYGEALVSAGYDGVVRFWNTARWEPEFDVPVGFSVRMMSLTPDGDFVAVGGFNAELAVLSVERRQVVWNGRLPIGVTAAGAAAMPDSERVGDVVNVEWLGDRRMARGATPAHDELRLYVQGRRTSELPSGRKYASILTFSLPRGDAPRSLPAPAEAPLTGCGALGIRDAAPSRDGRIALTCVRDRRAERRGGQSVDEVRVLPLDHNQDHGLPGDVTAAVIPVTGDRVTDLAWYDARGERPDRPDARSEEVRGLLVGLSSGQLLRVIWRGDGTRIQTTQADVAAVAVHDAWSPVAAVAAYDGSVAFAHIEPGSEGAPTFPRVETGKDVIATSWQSDDDDALLATVSSRDQVVRLFRPSLAAGYELSTPYLPGEVRVARQPGGRQFAVGSLTYGSVHLLVPKLGWVDSAGSGGDRAAWIPCVDPDEQERLTDLAWSSDGRFLAAGYGHGLVRIFPVGASCGEEVPVRAGAAVEQLSWRPNTRDLYVVTADGTRRVTMEATGSAPRVVPVPSLTNARSIWWAHRRDEAVVFRQGAVAGLLRGATDSITPFLRTAAAGARSTSIDSAAATLRGNDRWRAVWSPDDEQLAIAGFNGSTGVIARDGSVVRWVTPVTGVPVFSVDWSPDGKAIAVAQYDGTCVVRDAADGATRAVSRTGFRAFTGVAWAADGRSIVAMGSASSGRPDALVIDHRPLAEVRRALAAHAAWGQRMRRTGTQ